ncbi:MAG TPA: glycosyltransferase family 4 protein [Cyclobacteriaceae bacterium]|nr:glycosyltransferase family 4 protein [Cyclobacteriaceae bacterium]
MHDNINKQSIILFICHESSRTGAPISLLTLMEWLIREKNLSCRVIINKGGELSGSFSRMAPTLIINATMPEFFLTRFFLKMLRRLTLKKRIRKFIPVAPGLIYSNTTANGHLSAILKKMFHAPVITNVRELNSIISTLGQDNLHSLIETTDHYIAVSRAAMENLVTSYDVPSRRISVIYGAIKPPEEAAVPKEKMLNQLKLPRGHMIVGAAGMVDRIKGYDLFIDTADYVHNTRKAGNILFLWIGRFGRGKEKLVRERIRSLGLESSVYFLGESSDPYSIFNVFDIYYLSSREDTFPRAMLECGYLGIPTICFAGSGGCTEFVTEDCGILISNFDTRAAGTAMIELSFDSNKIKRLGLNAGKKATGNFMIDIQGENYYRVINEVMNREG